VFVDTWGVTVEVNRPLPSGEAAVRARDVMMLRFSDRGMSTRTIGQIFGLSHTAVRKRLDAIPEDARTYYRALSLDRLETA
jgi:response regulator of citrate/malate metabolism